MVDSHEISAFSISELSSLIKDGLETLFPQPFWVEGQISNFKTSRPGHCYFDLIEPKKRKTVKKSYADNFLK